MADIPQSWAVYARLQQKVSTTTDVEHGATLEKALNVILEPDYSVEATTEADFLRAAATAGRQERYRAALRRQYCGDLPAGEPTVKAANDDNYHHAPTMTHGTALDDNIHARRELARLALQLPAADLSLLAAVAEGISYNELARQHDRSPAALRTRVTRLRRTLCATPASRQRSDL